jgi:hypothetical protein
MAINFGWQNPPPTGTPGANWNWVGGAGGAGGQWVDSNYMYDAAGRQLSQQESAGWRNHDQSRATRAAITNANNQLAASSTTAAGKFKNFYIDPVTGSMQVYDGTAWKPVAAGTDYYSQFDESIQRAHPKDWFSSQMEQASDRTPEFDPATGTYHFRDSAGAWQDSSVADIYSKLSPYQQSLHSKDWYQDQATQASDSYNNMQRRQLDSRVGDAQRFGNMSTPQYRYPAGGI